MKRQNRKRLVRLILLPIVTLLVLIILAIAILFTQQQRLVGLAVKELNKQLPGELVVGSSNISVFQNFPYISIGLNKVQFYASKSKTAHPIYEAERMYVGFSLPDILKQKYRVKAIVLKNGRLDLVEDNEGRLNIAEASRISPDTVMNTADTKPTNLDLDIKKIVLKGMNISFLNKEDGQRVTAQIDRIQASFLADSLHFDADLQGQMLVDYTRPGDTTLFRHKHMGAEIKLSYVKSTRMLKLPVGKLRLEDAVFNFSGTADLLHDNLMDFKFSGDKPDFRQLFAFAP
ncbi:MAG TPA: AsmA family protein, partial [Puia sp.]|nr:AsmA family protein [Puia sp.]